MSRRRFENLEPERQHRLFDSAAEEFGAKGYDAAALIATETGPTCRLSGPRGSSRAQRRRR
jgi:hypothetical protein